MSARLRPALLTVIFVLLYASFSFAAITFTVTTASVYKSSSTTIGSGTALCTNVSIQSSDNTCSTALDEGSTYRFEFVAQDSGTTAATSPERSDFRNVWDGGDAVGSDATLVSCGCNDDGTNVSGTYSTNEDDLRGNFSGSFCNVEASGGSEVYYFIVTVGSDAASDTNPLFYIQDGTPSDSSNNFTLNVAVCGNNTIEGLN